MVLRHWRQNQRLSFQNLFVCRFFADFFMVTALLVKNYQIKLLRMFGIFSWFCVLALINFPFNLRHTKTIKTLMCENEQKPELEPESWKQRAPEPEPCSWKPRAPELEQCLWKEELRSRSCDIFKTATQPWNNPHCCRAMGAFWWGTRGTCPPHFFRRWGHNMPCFTHFFLLWFVFGEVLKLNVTFVTFCVKTLSC